MSKRKNLKEGDQNQLSEASPEVSEEGALPGPAPLKMPGFPIVGIGASAGGLEALESFFIHMPSDCGMAFVVIQHLDPTHKSLLLELIKRHTQMKIFQAEQGLAVEPNCIYVIPPNRDMTLRKGRLYLAPLATTYGLRLSIDVFFRSLAEDQAERAIGIILSGTGSDGALGLKTIKERGGLVIAQDPTSARYSGMPQNAIVTGLVDYILPPNEMPEQLLKYIQLAPFIGRAGPGMLWPEGADVLQKIFILLRGRTGHDFSAYKKKTVNRRIERRMAVKHIESLEEYIQYLQQNVVEVQALFKELLIGVTRFFRDPDAFQVLEKQILPGLFKERRYEQPIRAWVAGCATGEEAYCLAILLQEQMAALNQEFKVQLFATDIDQEAITKARYGVYPESIVTDISPERLQQFFIKEDGSYRVTEYIRNMVVCAIHSVIKDPPFSKLDFISCRNLLIYLEPELQKKVISLFCYALKPGGVLFLGASETLPAELAPFFTPIDRKWKIFQRSQKVRERQGLLDFLTPLWTGPDLTIPDLTKQPEARLLIEKFLLENYVQPCLIINEQSDIFFIYGRVGQYLEPVVGEVGSWNILRLVRDELRVPVGIAIREALAQKQAATYKDVPLKINGVSYSLTLTAQPILKPAALQGLMVVLFEEGQTPQESQGIETLTGATGNGARRAAELERELEVTKEYLQAIVEELESSNEEIKSTNEELQSANEELETAQEESQSVNEELLTLNTELQNKIEELIWVNSDINNVLASIDVGLIFLDRHMYIRRFNQAATRVANLIETDVGRPIEHIVSKLPYTDWIPEARQVFEMLVAKELEVQTKTGEWFLMRIRPYRTVENAIEGVVMTFTNITTHKQAIEVIEAERVLAESIVDTVKQPLLVLDTGLRVISANTTFYEAFKVKAEETRGQLIYELGNRQWNIPRLRQLLEEIIPQNNVFEGFEVVHEFPSIGRKIMRLNARQIKALNQQPALILLAIEEITEGK